MTRPRERPDRGYWRADTCVGAGHWLLEVTRPSGGRCCTTSLRRLPTRSQPSAPRVETDGWGARLLAVRDPDGQWDGGACFPRRIADDWRAGMDFHDGQRSLGIATSIVPTRVSRSRCL